MIKLSLYITPLAVNQMLMEDRYDFVLGGSYILMGGLLKLGMLLFEGIFRLRP